MANYYIGLDVGQVLKDATIDTSTQSKDVEVNVLSTNTNKENVLLALEHIKAKIVQSNWPPA